MTSADLPSEEPFERPTGPVLADQERRHRAWLNGEDTAYGAYDDAIEVPTPRHIDRLE